MTVVRGSSMLETPNVNESDFVFGAFDFSGPTFAGLVSWDESWTHMGDGSLVTYSTEPFIHFVKAELSSFNNSPVAGSYGYQVLFQEVGHALGLGHPLDGANTLPPGNDNTNSTVMFYTWAGANKTTYQSNDLLASRWIYGEDGPKGTYGFNSMQGPPQSPASDAVAPTVTSFRPADASAGVAAGANIVLTLSEAIQRGTGGILLKTAVGIVIASYDAATNPNLVISGSALTIKPTGDLATGMQYFVEVPTGSIKDLAGNSYAGSTSYDFTIEAASVGLVLVGTDDPDILEGGDGNDNIDGAAGDDHLFGQMGDDIIQGGQGWDWAYYSDATAAVQVDLAAGTATGADGSDVLTGIEGVAGSAFDDMLTGNGSDNDFWGQEGNDTISGGAGDDWVFYFAASGGVQVNLATGDVTGADGLDKLTGIEGVIGSNFADELLGASSNDSLFAWAGNDSLDGRAGIDFLEGGLGDDTIVGGRGTDTVRYGGNLADYGISYDGALGRFTIADQTAGRDGTDTVHGVEFFEFLDGTRTAAQLATDLTAPDLVTFSPADGATGVGLTSNIVLSFSETVQLGSGSIALKTTSGTLVETYDAATSANLSIAGSTLTINPSADLAPGTQYFVEFASGSVQDLVSNSYAGSSNYDFTTVAAPSEDDNFVAAQYASPAILGSGPGNDTYLLSSSLLPAGTSLTLSDAQGANSVQLAPGLAIASSRVGANSLQLTLANASEITLLGAAEFGYDAAANSSAGIDGADLSYASFARQVLGVAVPTGSTLNTGGAVVIGGGTGLPAFPAGTKSDDFVVAQYASPAILGAGTGDDTYLLSPQMLVAGTQMTISDAVGSNSVQLANGLDIASSRVAPGALQLKLVNGSVITVLGAAAFGYEAGGNRSAGIDGPDLSYADFALQVLGVAVPASGIAVGVPVLIGATGPANTITVPVGSMAPLTATAAADVFAFGVGAARATTANTQIEISGFATASDRLRLDLPAASGVGTLASLDGQQGVAVELNPFTGSTFVNFENDANSDLVAITLLGATDPALVQVEVV